MLNKEDSNDYKLALSKRISLWIFDYQLHITQKVTCCHGCDLS